MNIEYEGKNESQKFGKREVIQLVLGSVFWIGGPIAVWFFIF